MTAEAFRDFFLANWPAVLAHLMMMTGSRETAEDLAQVTFHAFYQSWVKDDRKDDHDRQRAWLYRVASNKAVDHYRRHRNEPEAEMHFDEEPAAAGESPEDGWVRAVLARDVLARCWQVIAAMPPVRRVVIVLHLYGLKSAEIASTLDISKDTVRYHRMIAVQQLRTEVQPIAIVDDDSEGEELA